MKYHTFLPQFHAGILAGTKTQTLRGSTRVSIGDRFALRHWTGRPYGSPMGHLGTAMAVGVGRVSLDEYGLLSGCTEDPEQFAKRDGFDSWAALVAHFGKRLPFDGVAIRWAGFVAGAP